MGVSRYDVGSDVYEHDAILSRQEPSRVKLNAKRGRWGHRGASTARALVLGPRPDRQPLLRQVRSKVSKMNSGFDPP